MMIFTVNVLIVESVKRQMKMKNVHHRDRRVVFTEEQRKEAKTKNLLIVVV